MLLAAAIGLPLGYFADTEAGAGKACHRLCECAADCAEPCAVRSSVAGAMAGRKCGPTGDSRADRLRAAADPAQYLCGIGSVDPALVDVANAMGMTSWQRLVKVEMPLAASVILAGLRTATVTCVGVATIAAAIGAGGLGRTDLSRGSQRGQRSSAGRSDSSGILGADCGRRFGAAGEAAGREAGVRGESTDQRVGGL